MGTDASDAVDEAGAGAALRQLFGFKSPARRREFRALVALMLAGAVAELVTIGAVLPFLALLADPAQFEEMPRFAAFFGALGAGTPDELLLAAAGLLVAAALAAGAIRLRLSWSTQRFVQGLGHEISVEIQRRVLGQSYSWHVDHNSRDIVASLEKVQVMTSAVVLQFMQMQIALFLSLFIAAALIAIDPLAAAAAGAALGLVYVGVSRFTRTRLARNSGVVASAYSERIGLIQESLGGIRDVIIDGAQAAYVEAFRVLDRSFARARAVSGFIAAAPRFAVEAAGIAMIAAAALLMADGEGGLAGALPVLGALALGVQRLLPLVQQVYHGWSGIAGHRGVLADILRLLRLPEPPPGDERGPPLPLEREIALEAVTYAYAGRTEPALAGISLCIARGERVALDGPSGSGKSSLADLVMGLIAPDSGRVLVDGAPLAGERRRAWRRSIAHVSQSIFLTDASIARNIAFGAASDAIDMPRVAEAARLARLGDFIDGLPEGYDTPVGERGVRLSGGQRQRLGIARALYKGAPVLVLDEATSALDPATEEAVLDSLAGLSGLTAIMIAHRLPDAARCDLVVRLEDGRIVSADRTDTNRA